MKRLLFFVLILSGISATHAQNVVNSFPYTENFDLFPVDNSSFAPYVEPNPQAFPIGWTNQTGDGADWYGRSSASTGSGGTGPTSGDHTSGSGVFLFMEDGSNNNPAVGLIRDSIDLSSLTNATLEYWVSSNSTTSNANYMLVEVFWSGGWIQIDSVGDLGTQDWVARQIDLSAYNGYIDLRFSVNTSITNFEHDICIDDLRIFSLAANDLSAIEIGTSNAVGRSFTSTALGSSETISLTYTNIGSASQSNIPVAFTVGATSASETDASTVNSGDTATHSFAQTADFSANGTYNITAWTALAGEADPTNDTVTLQVRSIPNPVVTLPWLEDFESWSDTTLTQPMVGLTTNHRFDFNYSGGLGRMRSNAGAGFANSGNRAITLDWVSGAVAANTMDITLNMASYILSDSVLLDFYFMDQGDETSAGDSIYVRGSDSQPWIGLYALNPGSKTDGVYNYVEGLNLSEALAGAGQTFTTSFQLRFGQADNSSATSPTGVDGITFDDIRLYKKPANDFELLSIDAPGASGRAFTSSAFTATETVSFTVANNGFQTQFTVPGHYSGIGSATQNFNTSMASGAVQSFNFTQTVDLSVAGNYNLSVWTAHPNDENTLDDTLSISVRSLENPPVTLPLLEDFESLSDTVYQTDVVGLNGSDRLDYTTDTQGAGRLQTNAGTGFAHSGSRSITFDRNSGATVANYLDMTVNMSNYTMADSVLLDFYYVDHADENSTEDRVWVRGSDSDSWIEVYDLAPASATNGQYNQVSGINLTAALAANAQAFSTSTQLRFGQQDNSNVTGFGLGDGITFDDVLLYIQPVADVGIASVDGPNAGCGLSSTEVVSVSITNLGFAAIPNGTSIDVGYAFNGNTPVAESTTLVADLSPGDTVSYAFTATVDLSGVGSYDLQTWTAFATDDNIFNDTAATVQISNLTINAYPYHTDFDALTPGTGNTGYTVDEFANGWFNPDGADFDWQPYNQQPTSGTATGPNGDHTGGGNFMYAESSSPQNPTDTFMLQYPCFDLSSLSQPMLSYWYHMHGSTMGNLFVDIDSNGTWVTIDSLIGTQQASNFAPWQNHTLDLSNFVGLTISVRFRAVSGTSFYSDIAIDDVGIFNGGGVFTQQPANDTICLSDTAWFTINHSSAIGYQWQIDDGFGFYNASDDSLIGGTSTDSLWVIGAAAYDGLQVRALAALLPSLYDTSNAATLDIIIPALDLGVDTAICWHDTLTLDAGSGLAGYSWSTSASTSTIDVTQAGDYMVTITDNVGCTNADTISISEITPIVNLGNDTTACVGDTLTLDAGSGFTAYAWDNFTFNQTRDVSVTGTYIAGVQDADGCVNSDTITVTFSSVVNVNLGPDVSICVGDSVQLTTSQPYASYTWSTSSSDSALTVAAGTYYIDVTTGSGCTGSDTVVVGNYGQPVVNAGMDITICPGDTAFASASGASSYEWYAGDSSLVSSNSSLTTTPAMDGFWVVYGTDSNGCVAADTLHVTVSPIPVVNLGSDTSFCDNSSWTLDAGSFASYFWSDSTSASTITAVQAGLYSVTVTDSIGCSASDDIVLSTNPSYLMQTALTICDGDSALLGGSYQMIGGTYYDTLSSTLGCDSVIETVLTVQMATFDTVATTICTGDSILLGGAYQTVSGFYTDSLSSAVGCDSIVVTDLSVVTAIVTNLTPVICAGDSLFAGGAFQTTSGTYIDTLIASAGCDSIVSTDLTVLAPIGAVDTVQICTGDSSFVGGAWQTTNGTYVDTLASAAGCDSVVSTTLIVTNSIQVNISSTICDGDSIFAGGAYQTAAGVYIDSLTASGGCDSVVMTTLMVNPTSLTQLTVDLCAGDSTFAGGAYQTTAGVYFDSLQTNLGCDSVIETTVTIITALSSSDTTTICFGDSIFVGGAWQTNAGVYTDSLSSAGGCDSIATTTVILSAPNITATDLSFCANETAMANGPSGFAEYLWSTGDTTQTIQLPGAGTYWVSVTSDIGCSDSASFDVQELALPLIGVIASDTMCLGDTITFTASGALTYAWSPSTELSAATGDVVQAWPASTTTFELSGIDGAGCSDTTSFTVVVDSCDTYVGAMPNALPMRAWMDQAAEDLLIEMGTGAAGNYKLEVFDLLGKPVYVGTLRKGENTTIERIDLSGNAGGMYILRVSSASGSSAQQVWKR